MLSGVALENSLPRDINIDLVILIVIFLFGWLSIFILLHEALTLYFFVAAGDKVATL